MAGENCREKFFMNDFSKIGVLRRTVYNSLDSIEFDDFCVENRFCVNDNANLYHILFWLYNQFKGGREVYKEFQSHNGFEIFKFCKTTYSPNCACFAIMLNDLLISLGYKSKAVWCLPSDPDDTECHALNHVWVNELNAWIVVDPSSRSIVCDELGIPIDLLTMRNTIFNGGLVYPHRNKTIRQTEHFIIEYNKYMKKNLFQFLTHRDQGLLYSLDENAILIHPIGFEPRRDKEWNHTTDISYIY